MKLLKKKHAFYDGKQGCTFDAQMAHLLLALHHLPTPKIVIPTNRKLSIN